MKITQLPFELNFSSGEKPCDLSYTNPKPWAGYGIDYKRTDAVYFTNEGVAFYIAIPAGAKELSYNLTLLAKEALAGEFIVEYSADFNKWSTLGTYSSSKSFTSNNTFKHALKPDVRYVRWVYSVRVKQNVSLNNISVR